MTPITLPVGSLIKFNSDALSEHNRSPMALGYNRIERTQRMSNGTLRKFFIVDKRSLNVSWDQLPSYSNYTIDGGYGALDLKNFYESALGKSSFPVTISYSTQTGSTTETKNMIFTAFSCEVTKRNVYSEIVQKVSNITAVTNNGSSLTYTASNSFSVGDLVTVRGLDTDLYNVNNAAVASANSTSFTVAKAGSQASVTEASSDGTKFTYYANNTFSAGDVVSISGFKTAPITAATTASGTITYTAAAHGFLVGDVINITGISEASYNKSKAVIASKTDDTFSISATGTGTPTFSGASASLVYNKTNVDVLTTTDYYFTITDPSAQATVVLSTPGTASLYSEATQFNITAFTPTANTNVIYTSANHDLEVGDTVSITGIRSTATITGAATHTTAGQVKYTASNTFKTGDIISISGITPSSYNLNNVSVVSATSSEFIVANTTTDKYRKGGSASSIFNLSDVVISAVATNTFTVPFTSASGSAVTELTGVKASKKVNYTASANTTSAPQEFWSVSLSLEEV
jgi:hypothetical protein